MARRGSRTAIGFMAVWLAFWGASILIVIWTIGGSILRGDFGATPFLLIWLAAAGLGLYAGARRLQGLLGLAEPPRAGGTAARHEWHDGPGAPPSR